MRISWMPHPGEGLPRFPVLRCACGAIYHLPHSVRLDELARLSCRDQARTRGWRVPDEGEVICPACRTRCEEKRYAMYVPDSICGDVATHTADGQPVCEVHARRSRLEGKKVEPFVRPGSGSEYMRQDQPE